jgi:hypothetical protein
MVWVTRLRTSSAVARVAVATQPTYVVAHPSVALTARQSRRFLRVLGAGGDGGMCGRDQLSHLCAERDL